eukprot:gene2386-biopygen1273
MLRKADTALQDDARDALLARQFMKGLPSDIRLRLLESNPTPSLHDMTSFVQRFRAIHHPDVASSHHVHAVQSASHAASPSHDDSLATSITQLTATVAALAADQKELRAAFTPPHGPAPPQCQSRPPPSSGNFRNNNTGFRGRGRWPTPGRQERNASQRSQRCFNCHMLGHFAKDCPWDSQCQLCYGWGHTTQACANNSPQNEHDQRDSCYLAQSLDRGPAPVTLTSGLCIPGRTEVLVRAQVPKSYKDQLVRLMNVASFDTELPAGMKISEFCPIVEYPLPSILPERFAGGNFTTWLRHFDRCARANMWNEGIRLLKLPAFLSGPAATYFDSLAADEKDTLPHLLASLQRCFTPAIDHEKFYRDFDTQVLRPAEDPSLYLWRLKDLLRNAEPDLSEGAFEALLRRQFMKGLTHHIRMKLLESDPTLNLTRMVDFAQRFRALAQLPADSPATCAVIDTIEPPHAVSPLPPPRDPVASQPQQQTQQQQRALINWSALFSKWRINKPPLLLPSLHLPLLLHLCLSRPMPRGEWILVSGVFIAVKKDTMLEIVLVAAMQRRVPCVEVGATVLRGVQPLFHQSATWGPVRVTLCSNITVPERTECIIPCKLPPSCSNQLGMISPKVEPSNYLVACTVSQATNRKIPVRVMNTSSEPLQLYADQNVAEFSPVTPVLAYPNFDLPFLLQTDASDVGLGAVLAQLDADGQERVIAYASYTLSQREHNYTAMEKEALAVVFAAKHFRFYLLGHKFSVITDNSALRWLHSVEPKGQIARWIMDLQEFQFEVKHRPGRSKQNADAISHLNHSTQQIQNPSLHPTDAITGSISLLPATDLLTAQRNDPSIRTVVELKEQGFPKPPPFVWQDHSDLRTYWDCWDQLFVNNGLLVRSLHRHTHFPSQAVVVPNSLVPNVLKGLHSSPAGGHMGITHWDEWIDQAVFAYNTGVHESTGISPYEMVFGRPARMPIEVELGVPLRNPSSQSDYSQSLPSLEQHCECLSLVLERLRQHNLRVKAPKCQFGANSVQYLGHVVSKAGVHTDPDKIKAVTNLTEPKTVEQTDASDFRLGAVLTQIDHSGNERAISYASRPLTDREKHYSATEKEALAVIFAVDHFRVYLLGRDFTLVTDHSALRWLHSMEPKGRLARWVMQLQEFRFDIKHRAGTANGNADALSRLPLSATTTCATTTHSDHSLQEAQRQDMCISKIIEIKSLGLPKPPLFAWSSDPQLKVFWHAWDNLFVHNGLLVKRLDPDNALPKYAFVIPTSLVESVLQGIHCSPFSGHLGVKRTLQRARERFYWPQMALQITDFVTRCHICAQNKLDPRHRRAPLQSIEVNEPFVFWAMDYMGPLPDMTGGNKHLLVVMDHFTKWCEVFATRDQKARTVAEVFFRFGPHTILHSDQGRNFEGNLMQEVCDLMGIHKSRTTAYHPQCDGLVERQNRTLQEMLAAFVSSHKDDWDLWVDLAVYAYNTSRHESTGLSPYELVFGRIAKTPLELDLGLPLKNPQTHFEYSESLRTHLSSLQKIAQQNLARSRHDQRSRGPSHGNWTPLSLGQSVWLRRPKSWKFGGRWVGPYEIISKQGVNYKIRSKDGKDMTVHHDNVKPCTVPFKLGEPFCPVRETGEITISPRNVNTQGTLGRARNLLPQQHSYRLRQNIRPPARFGEYITH